MDTSTLLHCISFKEATPKLSKEIVTFRNIDKSHRGRAEAVKKSTVHKSNVVENMEKPSEPFLDKWKGFE